MSVRRPLRVRGLVSLVAVGAVVVLLVGCMPSDASSLPSPVATSTASEPIFASDEDALAAAIDAYEAYRSVSNEISADGGTAPERIFAHVTPSYGEQLIAEFDGLFVRGMRTTGESAFDSTNLESVTNVGNDEVMVRMYMCRDVTDVRLLNRAGDDVTPNNRDARTPLVVQLVSAEGRANELTIESIEVWSGEDFC